MNIPFISYYASILSRLSYFDNTDFLQKYLQICNLPEIKNECKKIKNIDFQNIFQDNAKKIINKTKKKINNINLNNNFIHISSENIKYICISNSNYSSVYIIADKISNTIFVSFRGTYSLKSMSSYTKISSLVPVKTCKNNDDGYILGIFKIVSEIFYTIMESINLLNKTFLKNNNYKLITTGHSLGGSCGFIFSFLWLKYDVKHKICCITFGSPRVLNKTAIEKMIFFTNNNQFFFRRYVNEGDIFPFLPAMKTKNTSFYHMNENNINKINTLFLIKKKEKKKILEYHEIYLGISFKYAAQDLKNLKKEIKRNKEGDTICRIIIGGNNKKFNISFFNLNDAKYSKKTYVQRKLIKFYKKIIIDYKHQDIYINKITFQKIIKNGYKETNINLLNPLIYNKIISINHTKKRKQLFCL